MFRIDRTTGREPKITQALRARRCRLACGSDRTGDPGTRHTPFEPPGSLVSCSPRAAGGRCPRVSGPMWSWAPNRSTGSSPGPSTGISAVPVGSRGRRTRASSSRPERVVRSGTASSYRTPINTRSRSSARQPRGSPYGKPALGPGRHTIKLVSDPKGLSYIQAVSLARVTPSGAAVLCVGGRRYPVAWNAPADIHLSPSRHVLNCDARAVRLDWAQRL
jgi:hypothetical protein